MARDNIEHPLRKLLLSLFQVGCLGIGSGANLVLLREYFVTRNRFCTLKEFQNAYGITWLLPGAIASRLVAHLSYRTYPKWWIIPLALFLFSLPGFVLCMLFYVFQTRLPQGPLNHVTFFISLSFMFVFCLSAWRGHFGEHPKATGSTLGIIALSLALAIFLKPSMVQAVFIFLGGFIVIKGLIHLVSKHPFFKSCSMVFDPLLWIPLIKASLLLFGGVYAAIPYLYDEWVVHHLFIPPALYWQAVGIGQLTPGPQMNFLGYLGIAQGSIGHGYLMMMTYISLPCIFIPWVVKLEHKLLNNPHVLTLFTLLFPFLITQIFYFAITLAYTQAHSLWILAILLGLALLKEVFKIRFLPFLVLAIGAGLLTFSGCSSPQPSKIETVVIALPTEQKQPWQFDPALATRDIDLKALQYTHAGLMKLDTTLTAEPHLILPPKITDQGKVLQLSIRPDVRWSDGVPLTATHAKDGLIRALNASTPHPTIQAFKTLLPVSCGKQPGWGSCIEVAESTLKLTFAVAADLALPYFTQPFSFPQRVDVLEAQKEKPFLTPSRYPTLGPYTITHHDDFELTLTPREPGFYPIKLIQVETRSAQGPTNFNALLTKNHIHILESPPLHFLETSPWAGHLRAHPDFNVLLLLQTKLRPPVSLASITDPREIQRYVQNKGLPLATPPKTLQDILEACNPPTPRIALRLESEPLPEKLILYGPKHILSFLTAEALKKQVSRIHHIPLIYSALSTSDLMSFFEQHTVTHALHIFRARVPSLLSYFELFLNLPEHTPSADGKTYYQFLYQNFLKASLEERPKIIQDLLHVLCQDTPWALPLLSIPAYTVVSPRVLGYKREGTGVTFVWDLK